MINNQMGGVGGGGMPGGQGGMPGGMGGMGGMPGGFGQGGFAQGGFGQGGFANQVKLALVSGARVGSGSREWRTLTLALAHNRNWTTLKHSRMYLVT